MNESVSGPLKSGSEWSFFMKQALSLAQKGAAEGEIPVGALVLDEQRRIVSAAHNLVETHHDASAHAEILALREASRLMQSPRLMQCTLVVTLEPCIMCAASISHFRVGRVVYGAYDPKGGGVDHGPRLFHREGCLHRPEEIISGICEREAADMLKAFFAEKRVKL